MTTAHKTDVTPAKGLQGLFNEFLAGEGLELPQALYNSQLAFLEEEMEQAKQARLFKGGLQKLHFDDRYCQYAYSFRPVLSPKTGKIEDIKTEFRANPLDYHSASGYSEVFEDRVLESLYFKTNNNGVVTEVLGYPKNLVPFGHYLTVKEYLNDEYSMWVENTLKDFVTGDKVAIESGIQDNNGNEFLGKAEIIKVANGVLISLPTRILKKELLTGGLSENIFLKSILDNIPTDIAVWDLNHRYLYLNKRANADEGTRKWLVGKDDFEYCKEFNLPTQIAINRRIAFNHALYTRSANAFEEKVETEEGSTYLLRVFDFIKNEYGEIQVVVGYALNITELKQNQSDLKKMSVAMGSTQDGMALMDNNFQIYYTNQSFNQLFKLSKDLTAGKFDWDGLPGFSESDKLKEKVRKDILQNGKWSGEISIDHDGEEEWIALTLTVLGNNEIVCVARNVTHIKKQNEEIEKLALIARKTTSLVILADTNNKMVWVNEAFTKTLGYELPEILNKTPDILKGTKVKEDMFTKLNESIASMSAFSGDFYVFNKSGNGLWVNVDVTPIFNESGKLLYWLYVMNDVSVMKKAENALMQSLLQEKELNRLKTEFVSIASHEFMTPIAAAQSSMDLIREKLMIAGVYDKVSSNVKSFEEQILKFKTLVKRFLLAGKMQNPDSITPINNKINLVHFISEMIREIAESNKKDVPIILNTEGEQRDVLIDEFLLNQMLNNIIQNAIKFSINPNPKVIVHVAYGEQNFTIEVRDNGIGIPEKEVANVFKPFFRGSNAEVIDGSGLGLQIVAKCAQYLRGKIRIKSKQNQGTNVLITLPYE